MNRIETIRNAEGKAKELLDGVKKALGSAPNMFTTMAHAPSVLEFYLEGSKVLGGGKLSRKLSEQIALTTAGLNNCDYCAAAHSFLAEKQGVTETQDNLEGISSNPKVQAALSFATALVEKRGQVSEEDFQAVKDAGYSNEEIIEILAHVSFNTFTNYFNEAFGTEVDFPAVQRKESSSCCNGTSCKVA